MTKRMYNASVIAERIKTLRKEKGITQKELADGAKAFADVAVVVISNMKPGNVFLKNTIFHLLQTTLVFLKVGL